MVRFLALKTSLPNKNSPLAHKMVFKTKPGIGTPKRTLQNGPLKGNTQNLTPWVCSLQKPVTNTCLRVGYVLAGSVLKTANRSRFRHNPSYHFFSLLMEADSLI